MNSDDDDTEEAEVYAVTDNMAQPTSDIPGTGDVYALYERKAQQYLRLSDGGKVLANAVNNNPQTGKTPENGSSGSELGSNVSSCNELMSKSSQERITQQDVLLDEITSEKFIRDSTGAVSAKDIFTCDNDSIYTSGEQDVIDHHTVEVDEQQVSVTSDTPSAGSDEQFDDTSTADDDGCEKKHRSYAHSEKAHHDHGKEKLSVTHPRSQDNPTETREKKATERKKFKKIKSLYKEGTSWLEIKQYTKGFAVFGKLLQSSHDLSTNEYISMTITQICTNLDDAGDSDIPADLIQVPDSYLNQILKGLLDRRKWFPFLSIVRKHREFNASKEKCMDLVNEICLETVVGDPQFLRKTERLDNLMKGLLDIGATIQNGGQNCIYTCIKNGHYRILPFLLSRGAHSRHLTIYSGDTPVHAALTIALQKAPGHFEAFKLLLTKFQEDPQVNHMCDPTAKDRNGDGLLHLALRQPDGSQSRKAIDLLIQHTQNPSAILSKNKKGQRPSDLIREKHDLRWRILEPFFCCIPAQPKRQKGKKKSSQAAHVREDQSSSDLNNAVEKPVDSDTGVLGTTREFPSNEIGKTLTNDADSELSIDDKKMVVGSFSKSTNKLTEEIKERKKVKDVPHDKNDKEEGVPQEEEEKKGQNMSQGKEERKDYVPQEEEEEERGVPQEKKIEGNMQQKAKAMDDVMQDKWTEKEEKYKVKEEEGIKIIYTREKLQDTECKVEVVDNKVKEEYDDKDAQDVRIDNQKQEKSLVIRPEPARYTACARCYKNMTNAKEHLRLKRTGKAYTWLAMVIGETHINSNSNVHRGLVDEALTLVINSLSTTLNPEIPESLARIPVDFYQMIINDLAKDEKWRQVDIMVRENRKHHGDLSLRDFAKSINIARVIRHPSFVKQDNLLAQLIDNMLDSGAIMENEGKMCMLAAIQEEHFKLLCTLFERGANPVFLSLQPGDTPLHASMSIALERDKGNFTILNILLDKFKSDPEKFALLDPNQQDANGDCLFHLVAKMKYNSTTQKATELLCEKKISALVYNNEGKLPKDYLINKKNDRRLQFFRLASIETETKPATKKPKKPRLKMSEDDVLDEEQDLLLYSRTDETQARAAPEKVPRKDKKLIFAKTSTHRETAKKKIEEMIFNLPDTPYSIFNPKVPRMEEGWRSRRSGEGQKGARSPDKKDDLKVEKLDGTAHQADATAAAPPPQEEQQVEAMISGELEAEEDEEKETYEVDVQAFDNLEWEVECTSDVWRTLRDNHVLPELKRRIVCKVQHLASGEWRKSLCKPVTASKMPEALRIFEAKLSKGGRILWELAIAFSPRLSESAERRLNVEEEEGEDLAVRGGRIYSEVIRVWDIVFDHDHIHRCVERIIKSHNRGEECIIQKKLKGVKQTQFQEGAGKRYPMIYAEADVGFKDQELQEYQQELQRFYPPASSNDTEYHILKFYSFSSNLVYHVLQNIETKVGTTYQ
ncbi:uncharacterized protein LOC110441249 isoform X2 [Mizuhopecten yessoensis]|uniref:uncharacterized protein LOC110441249 isoform X2 n=1 Tax=Mizuhopecten yessoensis TaxID=6573 RepID=UPI000B457C82|nr:uncharacterized protein LOC110441249 isoform X2 [Mizuhopecten yessoensis]